MSAAAAAHQNLHSAEAESSPLRGVHILPSGRAWGKGLAAGSGCGVLEPSVCVDSFVVGDKSVRMGGADSRSAGTSHAAVCT